MTEKSRFPFLIRAEEDIGPVFESCWNHLKRLHAKIYLSRQTESDVKMAFFEAIANAIRHAHEIEKHGRVEGSFFLTHQMVGFEVRDHGPGFDLEAVPVPSFDDFKDHGRGIFMMHQVGDSLSYRQTRQGNLLSFRRYHLSQSVSAREIGLLYDVSEAVLRGAKAEEVFNIILDRTLEIIPARRASVLFYDSELKRLRVVASRGLADELREKVRVQAGEGVSGYVFRHRRPLLIHDIDRDRRGIAKRSGYQSRSFLSVPLIRSPLSEKEESVGVINLTDRSDGKYFTRRDLTLLMTLANQALASLAMRDLMHSAEEALLLRGQMQTLRSIQDGFFPASPPTIPGWEIFGKCEMAESLGGDYFDHIINGNECILTVADVSGHDVRSAALMQNYRSLFRFLASRHKEPSEILFDINQSLYPDLENLGLFVSALVMKINLHDGKFTFANAGHYPPISDKGNHFSTDAGLLLGIQKNEVYPQITGNIQSGESLLLFTDGVTEAMDGKRKLFGLKRTLSLWRETKKKSVEEHVQSLIAAVRDYRDTDMLKDDITVLGILRKN